MVFFLSIFIYKQSKAVNLTNQNLSDKMVLINTWEVIYMSKLKYKGALYLVREFFNQHPGIEYKPIQEQLQTIKQFLTQVPQEQKANFLNDLCVNINEQYMEMVKTAANHYVPLVTTQAITSLINAANQLVDEISNNGHNLEHQAHEQSNGGELGLL